MQFEQVKSAKVPGSDLEDTADYVKNVDAVRDWNVSALKVGILGNPGAAARLSIYRRALSSAGPRRQDSQIAHPRPRRAGTTAKAAMTPRDDLIGTAAVAPAARLRPMGKHPPWPRARPAGGGPQRRVRRQSYAGRVSYRLSRSAVQSGRRLLVLCRRLGPCRAASSAGDASPRDFGRDVRLLRNFSQPRMRSSMSTSRSSVMKPPSMTRSQSSVCCRIRSWCPGCRMFFCVSMRYRRKRDCASATFPWRRGFTRLAKALSPAIQDAAPIISRSITRDRPAARQRNSDGPPAFSRRQRSGAWRQRGATRRISLPVMSLPAC